MTNSWCTERRRVPLARQARNEMLHAAPEGGLSTWQPCIMAAYSKMITPSHYPIYLLRSYCDEINAHRPADREDFILSGLLCCHCCVSAAWGKSAHKGCVHDTFLSVLYCPHSDNGWPYSIPASLPATFEFNHSGSTVVQITLGSSTPSHYPGPN